jgi:hypothetical protein
VRRGLGIAVAFTLVLAACGGGSSRLQGKWRGLRADGVAPEAQARANDFAMAMELEVKGDTITVKSPTDKQVGKYKVVEETKAKLVIVTDKDGPDDKQTFTFSDDKTMKWSVTDGKTITFVRQ